MDQKSLHDFLQYIPFVSLATSDPAYHHPPLITRLLEAAIIGGVIMFGTVEQLGTRLSRLETEVNQMRTDLYAPRVDGNLPPYTQHP